MIFSVIKIGFPAAIALAVALCVEESDQKYFVFALGIFGSIYQAYNGEKFKNILNKEAKELRGLNSNNKNRIINHVAEPHIFAAATVRFGEIPIIENGFNISSITDKCSNEIHLNFIEKPDNKNIIPSVTVNGYAKVSVEATKTGVKVTWSEGIPESIYMTATYG